MEKLNSKKKYCIIVISLTIVITTLLFLYSNNLMQNNSEDIFLTQDGLEQLSKFKEQYGNNDTIVIKKNYINVVTPKHKGEFKEFIDKIRLSCLPWCEILTSNSNSFITLDSNGFLAALINIEYSQMNTISIIKQFENQKLQVSGLPYTNYLLNEFSENIKSVILPILFFTLYILILLFMRNILWSLIIFIPAVISLAVSLSIIKLVENELTLLTSIIPLVVSVLSLSIMLHLVFSLGQESTSNRLTKGKIEPILLTIITTVIGFSTLSTSNLFAVRQFGVIASVSVFVCSTITLVWFYCASKLFFRFRIKLNGKKVNSLLVWWSKSFSYPVNCFLIILCLVGGVISIKYIPVLTDATLYFPSGLNVKNDAENISEDVIGQPILEIVVDQESDNIKFLQDILQVENEILRTFSGAHIKIMSSNKVVQEANLNYANARDIPNHFVSYATLFSKAPRFIKHGYPLTKNYRITVLSRPVNIDQYNVILSKVKNILFRHKIGYKFNGTYFHLMTAQKEMIRTLAKSFIFAVLIVSLLAYFYYRKTKVFIIFMVINIMPVVGSFIFSNLFNLSINISTVMTYSISFGLLVDNSFHIIHAIKNNITGSDYTNSLVRPVLSSGILIILSFIVFSVNSFLPVKEFGITLAIITAIGVIFDLKVLPYFLSRIYFRA